MHWVESLLFRWAHQSIKHMDRGAGFRDSSLARMVAMGSGWASSGPPPGVAAPDMRVLDECIQSMPQKDRYLLAVLYKSAHGNKSAAARSLGLPRPKLYAEISRLHAHIHSHFSALREATHGTRSA